MRMHRTNHNDTGLTSFDNLVPTMSILGTKDGLYRISRGAESYWHGVVNIVPEQKGRYPVVILEGGSHGSFMDEDMLAGKVLKDDLMPEMTQDESYKAISEYMVNFIKHIKGEAQDVNQADVEAAEFFKPIIDAMIMEGSYYIKIPCYNISTINPDWPDRCERGNKWSTIASKMMAGDYEADNVELDFFDNFHRVDSMFPHHLP